MDTIVYCIIKSPASLRVGFHHVHCHTSRHQFGNRSLYYIASCILSISHWERSSWPCWKDFHKKTLKEHYTYNYGNMSFGHRWRHSIVSYEGTALPNKCEAVGACHGNLLTLQGFGGANFLILINLMFVGFNAIKLLQSGNTLVLTKALWYYTHLSTNLIEVSDIIIWKSLDKLVNTWDIKVTMKPWWITEPTEVKSYHRHCNHDDVIKWENFPCYWPFVRGIHRSPVDSPHNGQWHRTLMFSLMWTWTNGWANSQDAGDLRCHGADCDIIVMVLSMYSCITNTLLYSVSKSIWIALLEPFMAKTHQADQN